MRDITHPTPEDFWHTVDKLYRDKDKYVGCLKTQCYKLKDDLACTFTKAFLYTEDHWENNYTKDITN